MRLFFFTLVFCLSSSLLISQEDTYYLWFEEGKKSTCDYSVPPNFDRTVSLDYQHKRHRKVGVTLFILCREVFTHEFQNDTFKIIEEEDFSKITFTELSQLLETRRKNDSKGIESSFKDLFLIEKINSSQYAVYGIHWQQPTR